ncbi:MAG TPA: ATP-dependent helicase, partial [Gemmatimonadales bacterium]|nr:ATP-dependent helicase [Gemmatimonadales bacterium]
GRTARAEAVGDAFTFVAPDEEGDLRQIERVIGKRLPRVIVPDFDYRAREARLEIPLADRIAAIRAKKAEDRGRAQAKQKRRMGEGVAEAAPRDGPRNGRSASEGANHRDGNRRRRPGSGRS